MSDAHAEESSSGSPSELANSPVRVQVEDEVIQMVGASGEMEEFRHCQRSTTLMNMKAAAGTSVLPVTHSGIKLWQEAVESVLNSEIWHLRRTLELSLVVQVCSHTCCPAHSAKAELDANERTHDALSKYLIWRHTMLWSVYFLH